MQTNKLHSLVVAVLLSTAAATLGPGLCEAALSKVEIKCATKLARGAERLSKATVKSRGACLRKLLRGDVASCPPAASIDRVTRARGKLIAAAQKFCHSSCSTSSDIECINEVFCPPLPQAPESCSAGAAGRPFDSRKLGFPGPHCEAALGHPVTQSKDIGSCVAALTLETTETLISRVYGAVDGSMLLSRDAQRCLAAIGESTASLAATIAKSVGKCRAAINKGKLKLNPVNCKSAPKKAAGKIARAGDRLNAMVTARCTPSELAVLDLCGSGIGGILTIRGAQICLRLLAHELTDTNELPVNRNFSQRSLIEGIFPPAPVCGDNMVNQLPNPFLLIGEECDGIDDSACPGACFPPGDLFECTCATVPRIRFFASSEGSETDAGWTGLSHNQITAENSGFISGVENCNCDAMSDASCIGNTSDPVCDIVGYQLPVCSADPRLKIRCDDLGNGDGRDSDADCFVCDSFNENAGEFCRDESACQAQCYKVDGTVTQRCTSQADCPVGQRCRGQCDRTQKCIRTPNGGPLPVNAGGSAVCGVQSFRTDVSGTRDLQSGAHEVSYRLYSSIHLAENSARPCPVCGGFCVGGSNDLGVCKGTCEDDGSACRFTSDCSGSQVCTSSSPECPSGLCELSLICGASPIVQPELGGKPCRITTEQGLFGTVSNDCLPAATQAISGTGLEVDYLPQTSGTVTLASMLPCSASGLELYECPCLDDGGEPTRPNSCMPACNTGPNFGQGCVDGDTAGDGTRCAGGVNDGRLCDDDGDCPGSACSANPFHCQGDPAFEHFQCSFDADCGLGACVDACPGGRCVPLCVPSDTDVFDGVCAAGPPMYHCASGRFIFKSCSGANAGASCDATCSGSGLPCTSQSECPAGQRCSGACLSHQECEAGADGELGSADDLSGAGACIADSRSCFLDPIVASGGSTANGLGDATNYFSAAVWCFGANNNTGVNNGAGFGGPARVRIRGVNFANFSSLP